MPRFPQVPTLVLRRDTEEQAHGVGVAIGATIGARRAMFGVVPNHRVPGLVEREARCDPTKPAYSHTADAARR